MLKEAYGNDTMSQIKTFFVVQTLQGVGNRHLPQRVQTTPSEKHTGGEGVLQAY